MEAAKPFQIPNAVQWTMRNKQGATYRIMLWRPDTKAPPNGFPVYYLLDANAIFATVTETIRVQSSGPRKQEPAVVVGIGYDSDLPHVTQRRFVDYTLPASSEELSKRKNGMDWPKNGGIESFLDFIEEEVMPEIDRWIAIDHTRQAIFGHSLGGFCVLYTLCTRSHLFHYYAAGSPSIWWKNHIIHTYVQKYLAEASSDHTRHIRLFIGVGSEEPAGMADGAKEVFQKVKAAKGTGLTTRFARYQGESHISMLLPFLSQVVRDFREECI
ncbi:alpha/beta hydrolase-fold protein [Lentibacillus sp. N15]|uniref:alpha/beta hydrolase n=1 Tax=Lentibacillus songyuanensis TaxID=3136161 RepID=UPI0031BAFF21